MDSTDHPDRQWSAQERALIAGDLGDALYRVESFSESLDILRRMEQSHHAATLVVMDVAHPENAEPLASFKACVVNVSDDNQSLAVEVPMQVMSPILSAQNPTHSTETEGGNQDAARDPIPRGMALRGALQLDGVTITFESETLGTPPPSTDQRAWMLRARLPFRLYRIQRRDSFRVPLPTAAGVLISLAPGNAPLHQLRALDLSCGGASVVMHATLDAVHQGKRFPKATIQLSTAPGSPAFEVSMLVRHLHIVPPGLGQLLSDASHLPASAKTAQAVKVDMAANAAPSTTPGAAPSTALSAKAKTKEKTASTPQPPKPQPEWLQLGIEFERMPTTLERELSKRVNELAVNLVAGQ